MEVKVQIVNKSNNPLPQYETEGSVGMDLRANLDCEVAFIGIIPGTTVTVSTGLFVAVPKGYEMQIRPRSGLAHKNGITVLNSPGTIDSDYRGEIKVMLHNTHPIDIFYINQGDRIAQMVLSEKPVMVLEEVQELDQTQRGSGGFGHTGSK